MYSTIKTTSICLKSAIYPTTIQHVGFVAEDVNTKLIASTLAEDIKQNEIIFNNVDDLALVTIDKAKEIKLSDIFKDTNIENIENLYKVFEGEIAQTLSLVNDNYNNNIENINKFINDYINQNITVKILDEKLSNIIDIDETLEFTIKSILEKLNKNIESKELILKSIKTAYENNIVFNDLDFNENNQYIVDKIVFNCIESEFKFINKDTKDYIVKCIVDALLTTGIGFTVDAMKALKLKEITTEQVEIMDPREIHMLFKAFAGDFFIKLYLYGSMGAVFGINMYLSILLGIVDWFYSKKVDEFEISTDNIFKE